MKSRISPEEAIFLSQFIDSLRERKLSTWQKEEKLLEYLHTHFAECDAVINDNPLAINDKN